MGKQLVGMLSSYVGLQGRKDWLWQQSPNHFGVWGTMQMLPQAPDPDFLVLYQFNFKQKSAAASQKKSLLSRALQKLPGFKPSQASTPQSPVDFSSQFRGVPKERIIYLMREPPLPEVKQNHQRIYQQATRYCGYVSGPDDSAPDPDYMPAIWYLNNSFRELNEMPPPEKIETASWITSGINRTESHRKRLQFLQLLCDRGLGVDIYGRDLPPWVKGFGEIKNKWFATAPYYYNLAVENYAENDWYVSEKLWDALLSWCLPIYYGGSAADKLLPPKSFLRLPSLDEKGIQYIQEVIASPDAWYEAKDAIAEARQIILHELNLLGWLYKFVERSV